MKGFSVGFCYKSVSANAKENSGSADLVTRSCNADRMIADLVMYTSYLQVMSLCWLKITWKCIMCISSSLSSW